jgi:putative SOS response-associated peptidase YedK
LRSCLYDANALASLFEPRRAERMYLYLVSTYVNSSKNQVPYRIDPAA